MTDLDYTLMLISVFVGLLLVLRAVGHGTGPRSPHRTVRRDSDDIY